MITNNGSVTHPECIEGEIFLGNYTISLYNSGVSWVSKRMGVAAFDEGGNPIPDSTVFPVFITQSEAQITLTNEQNKPENSINPLITTMLALLLQ